MTIVASRLMSARTTLRAASAEICRSWQQNLQFDLRHARRCYLLFLPASMASRSVATFRRLGKATDDRPIRNS